MTALLFAVALAGAPAISTEVTPDRRSAEAAAACARLTELTVAPDGVPFWKLGDLPPPIKEHAVWRIVAGCPVREVIYKGQRYYLGSSPPKLDDRPLTGSRMRKYPSAPEGAPDQH